MRPAMMMAIVLLIGVIGFTGAREGVVRECTPDDYVLEPFVDMLPIPQVLVMRNKASVELQVKQCTQRLHRDLDPSTLWGYSVGNTQGCVYPGPTIDAWSNDPLTVRWSNRLPSKPIFDIEKWNGSGIVPHLHGGNTPPDSDGNPTHTFPPGQSRNYTYPNTQPATMLWYHDHAMGQTRVTVYSGLAGMYIIRDKHEESLNLPKGKYEVPLIIQDRVFEFNSSKLYYPSYWSDVFVGQVILVNGKVNPYMNVDRLPYRFRVVNGANARFFNLSLDTNDSFYVIGGDRGFLPTRVSASWVLVSPGERVDIIMDFGAISKGGKVKQVTLVNTASAPNWPFGNPPDPCADGLVMMFRISPTPNTISSYDMSNNEWRVNSQPQQKPPIIGSDVTTRTVTLSMGDQKYLLNDLPFASAIVEKPIEGSTEIWNFVNKMAMAHPMHIHMVYFTIIGRGTYNVEKFEKTGELEVLGELEAPSPLEAGPKDTVRVDSYGFTRVLVNFTGYSGPYVYHCHMLEHEDHDMMRPFEILPRS